MVAYSAGVRIHDKYLLREFALPWLYSFDAFVLLFVVMDALRRLETFLNGHARAGQVLAYYLNVVPGFFVMVLPFSLLLGVLFCLANLGKHNELVALRASGISVERVALPLLAVGVAASLAMFVVNEKFAIGGDDRANVILQEIKGQPARVEIDNFFFANTTERRDWYARWFNPQSLQLVSLEIHQLSPDRKPQLDIYAERAQWENGAWRFHGVDLYDYAVSPPLVTRVAETNFPFLTEAPPRMLVEGRKPDQLKTRDLRRYIRAARRAGHRAELAKYETTMHYRYAFPFTCFIVVWIGVPLGMRVSRRGPMISVGLALGLAVTFYFLTNILLALGSGHYIPPLVAAWATHALFAVIGGVLLYRVR